MGLLVASPVLNFFFWMRLLQRAFRYPTWVWMAILAMLGIKQRHLTANIRLAKRKSYSSISASAKTCWWKLLLNFLGCFRQIWSNDWKCFGFLAALKCQAIQRKITVEDQAVGYSDIQVLRYSDVLIFGCSDIQTFRVLAKILGNYWPILTIWPIKCQKIGNCTIIFRFGQ